MMCMKENKVKGKSKNNEWNRKNNKSNILIVEDSNIIRAQEAEVLRQRNYNIFESETGKDGIKIFEKENSKPSILLRKG